MKKMIVLAAFAGALAFSGAAFAAGKNETTPNRSDRGAAHAAAANENGNPGFIGQEFQGAPNYHGGFRGRSLARHDTTTLTRTAKPTPAELRPSPLCG